MLVGLVLGFLAYGPQAVLSAHNPFSFSPIQQCGQVSVNFSSVVSPEAYPLNLTILPFDSIPISIPLVANPFNLASHSGANITFFPYPANTTFIASLDDSTGKSVANVSDITRVLPSSNSSCLSSPIHTARRYTIYGNLTQCQPFNVSFNLDVVGRPPSVRGFSPRSASFPVNLTSKDTGMGTYLLDIPRGMQVVLMFDDGNGYRETSHLMTVGGDATSSNDCLSDNLTFSTNAMSQVNRPALPKATVIGISVFVGVLFFAVAILILLYVRRQRLRRYWHGTPLGDDEEETDPTSFQKTLILPIMSPPPTCPPLVHTKEEDGLPMVSNVIPRRRREGMLPPRRPAAEVIKSWLEMDDTNSYIPDRIKNENAKRESPQSLDVWHVLDNAVIFEDPKSSDRASCKSVVIVGDQALMGVSSVSHSHCHARDSPDVPICVSIPTQSERTFQRNIRPHKPTETVITPSNSAAVKARRSAYSHRSVAAYRTSLLKGFISMGDHRNSIPRAVVTPPDSPTRGRRSVSSVAATLATSIEMPLPVMSKHDDRSLPSIPCSVLALSP